VYRRASTVEEALNELSVAKGPRAVLAGGTDLLIQLRKQHEAPVRVVDISRIAQLTGISTQNDQISIGPLTTIAELASSPLILREIPVLAKAAASVGSPQIRNLATVGGNLCHASPCADTVPALVAYDARLQLQSKRSSRWIDVKDFFLGPYRAAIDPDEILVNIKIPRPSPNVQMMFYKLGRRKALTVARLNLVMGLQMDKGVIRNAIISPGSIMPTPGRLHNLEQKMIGKKPEPDLFQAIGQELSNLMILEAGERWSTPYKKPVVASIVARCFGECVENV
jgi:CO/xanthine dehydrogenase FAD-binding subunit